MIIINIICSLYTQFWGSFRSFASGFVGEDAKVLVAEPIEILVVNRIALF